MKYRLEKEDKMITFRPKNKWARLSGEFSFSLQGSTRENGITAEVWWERYNKLIAKASFGWVDVLHQKCFSDSGFENFQAKTAILAAKIHYIRLITLLAGLINNLL